MKFWTNNQKNYLNVFVRIIHKSWLVMIVLWRLASKINSYVIIDMHACITWMDTVM